MKCKGCGTEFKGKYCPQCGRKNDEINENTEDILYNVKDNRPVKYKMKWYFSVWFLIALYILTSFTFGIPAIIMTVVRLCKYKQKRGTAIILLLCFVGFWGSILGMGIYETVNINRPSKYIQEGRYDEAKALLDERMTENASYTVYSQYADLYEAQEMYAEAADILMQYCDKTNFSDTSYQYAIRKLERLKDSIPDNMNDKINSYIENYNAYLKEKESSEQEAQEKQKKQEVQKDELEKEKLGKKEPESDVVIADEQNVEKHNDSTMEDWLSQIIIDKTYVNIGGGMARKSDPFDYMVSENPQYMFLNINNVGDDQVALHLVSLDADFECIDLYTAQTILNKKVDPDTLHVSYYNSNFNLEFYDWAATVYLRQSDDEYIEFEFDKLMYDNQSEYEQDINNFVSLGKEVYPEWFEDIQYVNPRDMFKFLMDKNNIGKQFIFSSKITIDSMSNKEWRVKSVDAGWVYDCYDIVMPSIDIGYLTPRKMIMKVVYKGYDADRRCFALDCKEVITDNELEFINEHQDNMNDLFGE